MSGSRRVLIIGGIALAVWGMSYGLWYAVFAEHQALDTIGSSLAGSFAAAADRNPAVMESSLEQYREAKYVYDRQVDVHGHWIGLAMLLIVLGAAFEGVALSARLKTWLAAALVSGSIVFPMGVILQTVSHAAAYASALAIFGSAIVTVALVAVAWGFARVERS